MFHAFNQAMPTSATAAQLGRSSGGSSKPQFFKANRALVFNADLTCTEKLLLMAIGLYDWGDGRGGRPGNRELIRACGLKSDGKDGGQRCMRALLAGLVERRYIRVERVPYSAANPTGRVIHLLPRAFGVTPDPEPKAAQSSKPEARPTPGIQVRPPRISKSVPPPDVEIRRIDSSSLVDPETDQRPEPTNDNDARPIPAPTYPRVAVLAPAPPIVEPNPVEPTGVEPPTVEPTPDLTPGQRQFLDALDAGQRSRFDQLGESKRASILGGFRLGHDPIIDREARRALVLPPMVASPAPPTTTREMIGRLPGGDPGLIAMAAESLCIDFGSEKDRRLWPALRALAEQIWRGQVPADDVIDAYGQAMGPRAKVRGAVFTKALRNLGWST